MLKIHHLILLVSLTPFSASAGLFGGSTVNVQVSYACLGLDGIPISNSALIGQCCDGSGNLKAGASDQCRTSLYGAGTAEATAGTGASINIAQQTLDGANDLNGANTDYTAANNPTDTGNGSTGGGVQSSAITGSGYSDSSGSSGTGGAAGSTSNLGNLAGANGSGSGAGAGGAAGGDSGAGSLGSVGSGGSDANGTKLAMNDPNAGKGEDGAGRYSASTGGSGSGADGKGGLFGSLFGSGANGKGGADGLGDAKFSDEDEAARAAAAAAAAKDGLTGSSEDPADYFKRIDKSASIFKIVTNRYNKETARKHIGIPEITK